MKNIFTDFTKKLFASTILTSMLATLLITVSINSAFAAGENPTTNTATSITSSDATLNATNGTSAANAASFWVSTSPIVVPVFPGTALPVGVYSTPALPAVAASDIYSSPASAATGLPAITPGTTYYYVAWSNVGADWYPGSELSFTTSKLSQVINFNFASTTIKYGDVDFLVTATSDSALPVSLTSGTATVCNVSGFTVQILSAGTCTLNADQAGNGTYDTATQVTQSFTVGKKDITISGGDFAKDISKTYDGTTDAELRVNPTGVTFSGVINSDASTAVKLDIDVTSAAGLLSTKNASSTLPSTVTFSGYTLMGTKAFNYNLTNQPANETQTVTKRNITVRPSANFSKVYDASTTSTGTPTVTAGVIQTGDTTDFIQNYSDVNAGTGKTINASGTVTDGNNGENYNVTFTSRTNASIVKKELTVTGLTAQNKIYDATTNAIGTGTPALVGIIGTDNVVTAGSVLMSFADRYVGNGKTVNVTGLIASGTHAANYSITHPVLSANITTKDLTVAGLSGVNKVYDQLTTATLSGIASLTGVIFSDNLNVFLNGVANAVFLDENVGGNKLVTINGYNLIGSSTVISNYNFVAPTSTATITPKTLNVTVTGINKVYDANTGATVTYSDDRIAGDILTATGTSSFDTKNARTSKLVTSNNINITGADANNYNLATTTATTTADITKKDLTTNAISDNKIYDANTLASSSVNSSDVISGDTVTYTKTNSNFSDKNVANGKTVTTGGISLAGIDAGNYNLLSPTTTSLANITALDLIVSSVASNKVYDGLMTAAVSSLTHNAILGDVIGTLASVSSNFSDKNIGTGKLVTTNLLIGAGVDNTNYNLPLISTTTANITVRTLNLISASGTDKVYDGSRNGVAIISDDRVLGDLFDYSSTTSRFGNKNVANNKRITVSGVSISGTDANNYTILNNTVVTPNNVKVTAANLLITAENKTKVYGTTDPALTYITTGLITGDTLTGSLTRDAGENVIGSPYNIIQGTLAAGNNYASTFATGTLSITIADQTITVSPISDKNPNDAPFDITATTTSGLALTYSLKSGINACALSGNTLTLTGATGTCNFFVEQAGDTNYNATNSQTVTVNVIDTIAPVITLNGSSVINLFANGTYSELGATVYDFMSGTTTATISGDVVNTSTVGTYTVRYNAVDTSNNVATERTRTVIVSTSPSLISFGGGSGNSFGSFVQFNNNVNTNLQVLGTTTIKFRFTKNLNMGMRNSNDVRELQKKLNTLGYYKATSTSGNFDRELFNSVKAYQAANKLPSTGFFGPMTRNVINR